MGNFLAWQVDHYTDRLQNTTDVKARIFLRDELKRLKSKLNDTGNPIPIIGYSILCNSSSQKLLHT